MGARRFAMGDLSVLAMETGSRSLLRHEAQVHAGEIELFKRLQAKGSEVDALKKQMAALVEQHACEKQKLCAIASQEIEATSSAAGNIIEQKVASIQDLSSQMNGLITNGAMIVEELQSRLITGEHFPDRLPPPRNTEPHFNTPRGRPELPEGAVGLGEHSYDKLSQVAKASKAPLPGDQTILENIRESSSAVLELLENTDSAATEVRCIEIMRNVVRFVLQLREQVSWGDYVRPSMQHIEGPHVSVFSELHKPGASLDASERSELEALALQQDTMIDPLGVKSRAAQLQQERSEELAQFDALLEEVECKERPELHEYRARVTAHMDQVRDAKEADERSRTARLEMEKKQLEEMQILLHKVLKDVTDKVIDINEQQVNRATLLQSLAADEMAAAAVHAQIDEQENTLNTYEGFVKQRKAAVAVMGEHELAVLSHIEGLLTAGACTLFEGTQPMLMRQFEVLPDVYCQCAILEDLY